MKINNIDNMFFLMVLLLPALSHQYSIKVNGKVEVGDHVANILQALYNTFLYEDKTPVRVHKPDIHQVSNVKESNIEANAEVPFIEEIMSKNEITHLYGQHKNEMHKKNNIQV